MQMHRHACECTQAELVASVCHELVWIPKLVKEAEHHEQVDCDGQLVGERGKRAAHARIAVYDRCHIYVVLLQYKAAAGAQQNIERA